MSFQVGAVGTMMVVPEGRQFIPEGWLLCDGKCYMKEHYPLLYDIYGYNRGTKDPPDTFRVPDQIPAIARGAIVQLIIRAA